MNCPYCHELVDAVDAGEGKTEPCPYCEKPINRLELGLAGTDSAISYKSVKASPDFDGEEGDGRVGSFPTGEATDEFPLVGRRRLAGGNYRRSVGAIAVTHMAALGGPVLELKFDKIENGRPGRPFSISIEGTFHYHDVGEMGQPLTGMELRVTIMG